MNIYLLKDFNKYSNRILKLDDISTLSSKICGTYQNINFLENDGVSTEIILNRNILEASNPDYLMAVGSTSGEYDSNWFITSSTRLRTGQVKYKLRRDLIRDNWDSIKESTLFINKGYVPYTNSLFFNPEPISVNQILSNVKYLYELSNYLPWLVAYVSKGDVPSEATSKIEFGNATITPDLTYTNEATLKSNNNLTSKAIVYDHVTFNVLFDESPNARTMTVYSNGKCVASSQVIHNPTNYYYIGPASNWSKVDISAIANLLQTYTNSTYTIQKSTMDDKVASLNGKIIKFTETSNYYKMSISLTEGSNDSSIDIKGQAFNTKLQSALHATSVKDGTVTLSKSTTYSYSYQLADCTAKLDSITYNNTNHTLGAAYDVVCCPYLNNVTTTLYTPSIKTTDGTYNLNPELCKDLFTEMSAYLGSSYVYDVQLLPYCPLTGIKASVSDDKVIIDCTTRNDYQLSTNKTACLFYSSTYQRTFTIDKTLSFKQYKKNYITTKYKLVAPNFSSEIDIDPNKNGSIHTWHVNLTCLPYNPWIDVHPVWSNLNGIDIDDTRGLICGGSFSLSQLSNSWTEYQYNNSNYSQIFESQLAYQKYQQKMNMISSAISGVSSAIGSGVSTGALASAVPGAGVFGAVAGGVTAAASLAGLGADLAIQNKMNNKANEYMTTQYNLQLGNVQALPSTLSKITAFNLNTKLFPMIYTYTCTDAEQEMVDEYFKYNGMTINAAGKLEDYVERNSETFISARILRWSDTGSTQSDYNYLSNINAELQEGVYITWQV